MLDLAKEFDIKMATTDQLAFVGDAVYSLLVRERLCVDGKCRSNDLHTSSAKLVKANGQAEAFKKIESFLSEKELSYYKKGRNAHNNHTPKNATEGDYHSATGVETLFGYLYLSSQNERIYQLFDMIFS
ncbi:MAG: ribonuclease III [Clostridia bacterium]|nr:ribonuclease III [Clostridia bacterium]